MSPRFSPTVIILAISCALLLPRFTVGETPEQTAWPGEISSVLSPQLQHSGSLSGKHLVSRAASLPGGSFCWEQKVGAFPHLKAGIRSERSPGDGLGHTRLSFLPQKLMRLKQTSKANRGTSKNALSLFLKMRIKSQSSILAQCQYVFLPVFVLMRSKSRPWFCSCGQDCPFKELYEKGHFLGTVLILLLS